MMRWTVLRIVCRCLWLVPLLLVGGCASTRVPSPPSLTKETLYARGHLLYIGREYDSAAVVLQAAAEMDSMYLDPVSDLAQLYFDRGMIDTSRSPDRARDRQRSLGYYTFLEGVGRRESDTYDRIGALALALNDHTIFLTYAKKNADRYPFDRQYYNLGIAYYRAEQYQASIRVLKEAVEKFRDSEYIGGMYRQLGRSYMSVDRNQTAERVLYEGLSVVDRLLAVMRRGGTEKENGRDTRLTEDRIGILLSLKGLHTLYNQAEKLTRVEQLLRQAGYSK